MLVDPLLDFDDTESSFWVFGFNNLYALVLCFSALVSITNFSLGDVDSDDGAAECMDNEYDIESEFDLELFPDLENTVWVDLLPMVR